MVLVYTSGVPCTYSTVDWFSSMALLVVQLYRIMVQVGRGCTGVLVKWYTGVLVKWCTCVLVHWCIGVLVHWCIGVLVY